MFVEQWIGSNSLRALGFSSMDKGLPSNLLINDGSFMEKFKQLQQEKEKGKEKEADQEVVKRKQDHSGSLVLNSLGAKTVLDSCSSNVGKGTLASSGSKLAFSLKQKSKAVVPSVKLDEDEQEDEKGAGDASDDKSVKRQKLCRPETPNHTSKPVDVACILIPYQLRWKEVFNERFAMSGTCPWY